MRAFYYYVLLAFNLLLLVSTHGGANNTKVYIVYMGSTSSPSTAGAEHAQLLSDLIQRKKKHSVVQTYNKSFLGFAARLSKEEAKSIAGRPGVLSVFPDSVSQLHTTHSWDFLRSQAANFKNINPFPTNFSNGSMGRDTIIGIIDTGIWPQHPSFNDAHMSPIPQRWKGICMIGENSTPFKCNRKVIGARYYGDPDEPSSITTAMDGDGHGTHVASTAAGMPVHGASYYSLAKGVARGGSPTSRIATYRACGDLGCADSSILKAFDDAIADGVDVISISFGGDYESFLTDVKAIGAFHATEKKIMVVASAGNKGPSSGTVQSVSPWILTVAATTMDRDFEVGIILGDGNKLIKGGGINFPVLNKSAVYDLVDGRSVGYDQHDSTNATNCIPGSLDDAKVKGKIVLCENNDKTSIYDKIDAMVQQGVIGIILINNYFRQLTFDLQITTPFAAVSEAEGTQIQSYINSTKNPLATILPTKVILNHKPAPVVAIFSSRGPAPGIKNLLKPDVAAPGVQILAAWRFNDTGAAYPGKEPPLFMLESGTSMSCPHVSGLAATVMSWHPTWTPSAIRSAIMTTAISTKNSNSTITTITGSRATPYDIGAGEISLFEPLFPGLIYETETIDYVLFLCNLGYNTSMIKVLSSTVPDKFSCPTNSSADSISNMNYPSIVVSGLTPNEKKTVKRTATNVGYVCSTYTATVEVPAGVHVQVVPDKLHFTEKVKKLSFQVTFILLTTSSRDDLFGSITWANNFHRVRSPFVVSNA